jgi:hypothetical protein
LIDAQRRSQFFYGGCVDKKNGKSIILLKRRKILLPPPFPKGEKVKSSTANRAKSSPPFEKGRMGGIYGRAFQKAKVLQRMKDSLGPYLISFSSRRPIRSLAGARAEKAQGLRLESYGYMMAKRSGLI